MQTAREGNATASCGMHARLALLVEHNVIAVEREAVLVVNHHICDGEKGRETK